MGGHEQKITIRIPKRFLESIDFLVNVDDVSSRSEAVRAAIRDYVYNRMEVVTDRLRKMRAAEAARAEAESTRREFLQK